jgi:hypothetical protein
MARLFVRHQVADYDAWRKVFDEFADFQTSHGVTALGVYRSADDANDVTVHHDFETVGEAKAFAAADELRDAMGRAGVQGQPQIWFTEEA